MSDTQKIEFLLKQLVSQNALIISILLAQESQYDDRGLVHLELESREIIDRKFRDYEILEAQKKATGLL